MGETTEIREAEQKPFFTGSYEHTLDPKGRVSLPAKIRRSLPSTVKTVLSLDGQSVWVFSPEAYVQWYAIFFENGIVNSRSAEQVNLSRRLSKYAMDADIDAAGRISIDARLRQLCGLEKDVTIIGSNDHLEIMERAKANALDDDLLSMDFMLA